MERLALHGAAPVCGGMRARWPEHGEPERQALERVLRSGSWGGFPSPNTEASAFGREFAAYVGSGFALPCANGTFSLALALQAARVSPGAEVITSAYTFVGTAGGIIAAGCVPVLVDVLPGSYCLDPDQVAAAITSRTEAVLPVHLACALADMDRLAEICRARGLLLVEDCAHAHGARWRGRGVGALGDLGSFSMQSSKLLTAGEGGAVTTSQALLAQRVQALLNCGRREPGSDPRVGPMLGHNLRMTEWQAALLRAQLTRLPEQHARRARAVAQLEQALAGLAGLRPLDPDPRVTLRTYYQYVLRYDASALDGVPRDHFAAALRAEGVPCAGAFYVPLCDDPLLADDPHTNPLARLGVDWRARRFPVAQRAAYEESLWLPHELLLGDVTPLIEALARVVRHAGELRARPPTPEQLAPLRPGSRG
jgi:dTDP-4-amino-4,6-dideoxygalactose transaminase